MSYLEPQDQCEIWVICWQGWEDFGEMIEQITRRVASFADGVNTAWFGQGMGGLVAYEVLKKIEEWKLQMPNLPISLIVSDCPAPHLFAGIYTPYTADDWEKKLTSDSISELQRALVTADTGMMLFYNFDHEGTERLHIPIAAIYHEGEALADAEAVEAWEVYSKEGAFEAVKLGPAETFPGYMNGLGYGLNVNRAALATVTQALTRYNRWIEDGALADFGPSDGPLPESVDVVIVGAGIAGLQQAKSMALAGKSILILDKHDGIGGVWNFYGNDYSRVNTSEVGYRYVDREGPWVRPNEDHTPRRDILRDMHEMAKMYAHGRIRLNLEVVKVTSCQTEPIMFAHATSRTLPNTPSTPLLFHSM